MKYNIYINQLALVETSLDIIDGAILDYIHYLCGSTHPAIIAKRINENNETWTWIDLNTLSEQMPILKIKDPTSFGTRLRKIEKVGFISLICKREMGVRKLFVRKTPKFDSLMVQTIRGGEPNGTDHYAQAWPNGVDHQDPNGVDPVNNSNNNTDNINISNNTSEYPIVINGEKKSTMPAPYSNLLQDTNRLIVYLSSVPDNDLAYYMQAFPTYPRELIMGELEKARVWAMANRAKSNSKKNFRRFMINWLGRLSVNKQIQKRRFVDLDEQG